MEELLGKNRNFKGLGSEAMELLKEYAFNKINLNSIWTGVNEKILLQSKAILNLE